jgi:hypothetical protein
VDDQTRPMLNARIKTGRAAGEEFAAGAIARMNRGAEQLTGLNQELFGPRELTQAQRDQVEKWKQGIVARFSELTGLQFDANGKCTTPGGRMESYGDEWAQVCREVTAKNDSQSQGEPQDK